MFAIVCDLPVPGGPWTTSPVACRAIRTARAWQGSAWETSRSSVNTRLPASDCSCASVEDGGARLTSARRKLSIGPAWSSPSTSASRSSITLWFESG